MKKPGLSIRLKEANIAFTELKEHTSWFTAVLLLLKTGYHIIANRLFGKEKSVNDIEEQFLPFIFLYRELKKNVDTKSAREIGGKIVAQSGVLDLTLTFPALQPDATLNDYLDVLKTSKYFQYSDYSIVDQTEDKVEIRVDRCGYCDVLAKYNMMELAPYVCESDKMFFEEYHPRLEFELKRSIASGDECCEEIYRWK